MGFQLNDFIEKFNSLSNLLKRSQFYLKLLLLDRGKELRLSKKEQYLLFKREQRVTPIPFIEKQSYMISDEWKLMQKIWMHEIGYKCQMFPFIILGKHGAWANSYYGKFAIHHTTRKAYKNLGMEVLNKDVIVLSKFAHESVFHFICSFGKKKVRDQKLFRFPNFLQVACNLWCKLNEMFKLVFLMFMLLGIFLL